MVLLSAKTLRIFLIRFIINSKDCVAGKKSEDKSIIFVIKKKKRIMYKTT